MTTYEPRTIDDEPYTEPYLATDPNDVYVAHNAEAVYQDPNWELLDVTEFLDDESTTFAAGSRGFVGVSRGGGRATVRTTMTMNFSGGIPLNGQVSGSVSSGSVFTGPDRNNNGMPDIVERMLRSRNLRPATTGN